MLTAAALTQARLPHPAEDCKYRQVALTVAACDMLTMQMLPSEYTCTPHIASHATGTPVSTLEDEGGQVREQVPATPCLVTVGE